MRASLATLNCWWPSWSVGGRPGIVLVDVAWPGWMWRGRDGRGVAGMDVGKSLDGRQCFYRALAPLEWTWRLRDGHSIAGIDIESPGRRHGHQGIDVSIVGVGTSIWASTRRQGRQEVAWMD